MADDLGFDFVAYAREVMADKNHKDRDDLSCLAMEVMGALVSSIDRLRGRLDSLHRSKVEYATAERDSLRLALETATREAAAHWRTVESLRERLDKEQEERGRQYGLRLQITDEFAFLRELLVAVVKTGTKDPLLDARITEELRSHE